MNPAAKSFSPSTTKEVARRHPASTSWNPTASEFIPGQATDVEIKNDVDKRPKALPLTPTANEVTPTFVRGSHAVGSKKQLALSEKAPEFILGNLCESGDQATQSKSIPVAKASSSDRLKHGLVANRFVLSKQEDAIMHGHSSKPSLRVAVNEFVPGAGSQNKDSTTSYTEYQEVASSQLQPEAAQFYPQDNFSTRAAHGALVETSATKQQCSSGSLDASAKSYFFSRSDMQLQNNDTSDVRIKPKPLCRFFQQGACRHGLQCHFSHDLQSERSLSKGVRPPTLDTNDKDSTRQQDAKGEDHHVVVDEGIRCRFGPGATVLTLHLGQNDEAINVQGSKRILISGLDSEVTDFDVEARLSTFGPIAAMVRKHPTYAYCTYEHSGHATQAADSLNGTVQSTWSGLSNMGAKDAKKGQVKQRNKSKGRKSAFVSVVLVAETGSTVSSSRNATVKVQWYAPSRVAWLHFRQKTQAQKAARACQGKVFSGRTISCRFQLPSFNQTTSFSVWVGGLAENVNKDQFAKFVAKHSNGVKPESIQLERASFHDLDGAQAVRNLLLSKGGLLVQFDEDKDNYRFSHILKRKALAKFAKNEDAARACAYFRSTDRVPELGGTKVHCQRVFSAKFTLPTYIFALVQDACRNTIQCRLRDSSSPAQDIRFKIFNNPNLTSSLLLQADNAKKLASLKNELSDKVDGVLILDPCCTKEQKVPLWKDFFASKDTATRVMDQVVQRFGQGAVAVLFHRRRREVRLFARDSLLDRARDLVGKFLTAMKPIASAVPIGSGQYKFLLVGGKDVLDKLITLARANVSLNLKHQSLLVEGNAKDARRAVACLVRMMCSESSSAPKEGDEELCPVCFCSPEEDAIALACEHSYCRDCFLAVCGVGRQTCDFPIQCLAEGCSQAVSLEELDNFLPRPEYLSLLRSAVDNHVTSNISKYQFCLSAGCSGIYTLPLQGDPSSRTATCCTCQMILCTSCKVQEHEGLTCQQYKIAKLPPTQLRNHIVEEILTLRCPRCSCAFLDFDGCFALTCSNCKCGFCGWCLKDCGYDAHAHVKTCPSKPPEARNEAYFGTKDQFQEAQRKRRRRELIGFLQKLDSVEEQQAALFSLRQDLKDLGLNDVTMGSLQT